MGKRTGRVWRGSRRERSKRERQGRSKPLPAAHLPVLQKEVPGEPFLASPLPPERPTLPTGPKVEKSRRKKETWQERWEENTE